jgi:uncharacterized membrane protein YphA (DoxX/SURF4 family)
MNVAARMAFLALRFLLGIVLIVAGTGKIPDPAAFATAIDHFQILPTVFIPAAALALPFLEIALGGMLITGWRLRCAAFSTVILFGIYTAAVSAAVARHLQLECDCFGPAISAPYALLRDVALLATASVLYGWTRLRARP